MDGYKLTKIDPKMTRYKLLKKWSKKWILRGGSGGVKIVKNRPRGTGTPNMEFFEILHFSTKAPPLFDPKIDPYKWPIGKLIPHK
jgi:hypothetical protein